MSAHVDIRVVRRDRVATCEACNVQLPARQDGTYEVSPHLRAQHGFDGEIDFEKIADVICPPMIVMRATNKPAEGLK